MWIGYLLSATRFLHWILRFGLITELLQNKDGKITREEFESFDGIPDAAEKRQHQPSKPAQVNPKDEL